MTWTGESYIILFNFWYFLGVSPFQFTVCPNTGLCKVRTNWIQKVFCGFLVLFNGLYLLGWVRNQFVLKEGISNIRELGYFEVVFIFGTGFSMCCLFVSLWRYQSTIEEFINFYKMSVRQFDLRIQSDDEERKVAWCVVLVAAMANELLVLLKEFQSLGWDLIKFGKKAPLWGQAILFMESINLDETHVLLRYFVFVTGIAGLLITSLVKAALESILIMAAFSMVHYLQSLERKAETMGAFEGLYEYSKLQHLLRLHNDAFGLVASGLVFGYIPSQVFGIPELIQPTLLFRSLEALNNVFLPILFLIISAWITNKANLIFKKWLIDKKHFLHIPEPRLSVFMYELGNNDIGFHAFGLIHFDTAFLGAISTLILTFAVVIIQFQSTK